QDDITRKRPSIDLLANLLCPGIDERLALLERFNPCAPLVRSLVVQCGVPAETPLLARPLALDALWRNFLLGRDELDPQLARFARLTGAGERGIDAVGIEPRIVATVKRFARRAVAGKGSLRLALSGPNGSGKLALVQGLAHDLGLRLLVVDLRDAASPAEVRETLARARMASGLLGALPYIHGVGPLAQREPQLVRAMTDALASSHSWFVLSLNAPLAQTHGASLRAVHLALGFPSTATRLTAWRSALSSNRVEAGGEDIERVATRFRLSAAQIEQAAV